MLSRRSFRFFVLISCYYGFTGQVMRWYFNCNGDAEGQSCRDALHLQHMCICCTMAVVIALATMLTSNASKAKADLLPLTVK